MKINLVHRGDGITASYSLGPGLEKAFRSLGHEVKTFVGKRYMTKQEMIEDDYRPFLAFLEQPADMLVVMGGGDKYPSLFEDTPVREYLMNLQIPKICYEMESMTTLAYNRVRYRKTAPLYTRIYAPDEQDVELLKTVTKGEVRWWPGMVDEEMFKPGGEEKINIRFLGRFYGFRQGIYMKLMNEHKIAFGRFDRTEDYVNAINEAKILLDLPSRFNGLSGRIFETLACGKFILRPNLNEHQKQAKLLFSGGVAFYTDKNDVFERANYYLQNEEERKRIAKVGHDIVLSCYTSRHFARNVVEL